MRLKKKTGIMMAATAAVAVVGVAAVSFAAWQGNNTNLTVDASTGDAYLFGFTDATPTMDLGELVPWNQPATSIKDNAKAIVSVQLPNFVAYDDYSITVESTTTLQLYVYVGAEQDKAMNPTSAEAVAAGWKAVQVGENGEKATFDFENVTAGNQTTYLSLLLVSTDYEADHGQDYSLNVTLVDANAVTEPNA